MAEIEITLPTVQYGNVKARFSPEEFGLTPTDQLVDPSALGVAAAVYLNLFTQGFEAGSQMDVSAPVTASQEAAPGDPQAAADRLSDGRSPRTVDEANEMARQVIENELGPTSEVPWENEVASKPKPWEVDGVTAPAVLDALGDGW